MAKKARKTGVFFVSGEAGAGSLGSTGAVRVTGKDARRFLHGQLTNEVNGLRPGEGNLTARVTRTGHLAQILSLRRLPADMNGCAAFLLLMEKCAVSALIEMLDQFLFADDVTLSDVSSDFTWVNIQGPLASATVESVLEEAPVMGDNAVTWLAGCNVPPGSLLISHSITGDPGLIAAVPKRPDSSDPLPALIEKAARENGLVCPTGDALEAVLDILRIEAGLSRVGTDTPRRARLLSETGLERQLVSYSKGCYIGQEVIARVRTYGSLPFELRGLVVVRDDSDSPLKSLDGPLEDLPEIGDDLLLWDGTRIGQITSRTFSPAMNAVVAMAYVDRDHRTPGKELVIKGKRGFLITRVVLLPFYRAQGHSAQALAMYEHAIRAFADGKEEQALSLLEKTLTMDATLADAYEAVGVILGRAGRFEEAISTFERLEEIAPDEPMVNTNLSLYYIKLGDKVRAEEHSARAQKKSLVRSSAGGDAGQEGAAVQKARRDADAERKRDMFSKVLEIDSEDPIALFGLGNAFSVLEEWEKAEESYARAMTVQTNNSAVFLARGKALERLGRWKEALAVYKEGLEVASRRGDMTPLREIETRVSLLELRQPTAATGW